MEKLLDGIKLPSLYDLINTDYPPFYIIPIIQHRPREAEANKDQYCVRYTPIIYRYSILL